MKRQLTSLLMVLLAVLAATTLTACGDDKDDVKEGKLTSYLTTGYWLYQEPDFNLVYAFREGGQFSYYTNDDGDEGMGFGTYTFDEKAMTIRITLDGYHPTFKVVKLTSKSLVLDDGEDQIDFVKIDNLDDL